MAEADRSVRTPTGSDVSAERTRLLSSTGTRFLEGLLLSALDSGRFVDGVLGSLSLR